MSILDEIKQSYREGSVLIKLIYINIVVFLTVTLVPFALWLGGVFTSPEEGSMLILSYISVPSDTSLLVARPWTFITYMFTHKDFLHILFNLLYIFWFGRLFLEFLNTRQLLATYIYGGIGGAICYLITFNTVPALFVFAPSGMLLGASASAMAILFASATYRPNHQIYLLFLGAVKLKFIALGALIIDLISMTTLQNTGGHLAHIGGALIGFLFIKLLASGHDISKPLDFFKKGKFKRKGKMTVTHKRAISDLEYNSNKIRKQQDVDRVLEKIKRSGYDSLTPQEKKLLFEASQE